MTATPANVRTITGLGDPPTDDTVQLFIDTAELLTANCTFATTEQADRCAEYLAAHLLAASPVGKAAAQVKTETLVGDYSVTFANASKSANASDVMSSGYGETANMLSNGCLAQLGKTPVSFNSIGAH
jgi:hypothetical protein